MTPTAVRQYAAELTRERAAALAGVAATWSRMTTEFDPSWSIIRPQMVRTMAVAQERIAQLAADRIPNVIETTAPRAGAAEYAIATSAWLGVAGDGRRVDTLLDGAIIRAKRQVATGAPPALALQSGGKWLTAAAGTVLSDTHRGIEQMTGHAHHVSTYVRMLNPPSCGRCIILAGRTYRMAQAFDRHPECDCAHIPAVESIAGDILTNPGDYLDGLDDEALARALGSRANAEAYKDGADVNQLINAYRRKGAVTKAQVYGRTVSYTTEGMTVRGWGYQSMRERHGAMQDGRRRSTNTVRLMPSTIYEIAETRADALRLLRTYGWIL